MHFLAICFFFFRKKKKEKDKETPKLTEKLNSIRKRSPDLGFANLHHPECEAIQSDFECEPVQQLEMEVDDIVIHDNIDDDSDDDDDDLKSNDNDLCPIANDPFKLNESKHFDKGMLCMAFKSTFESALLVGLNN